MDGSNSSNSNSSKAGAPVDPKQVLNNPHMLAGSQALQKAYNKYNIKATHPSGGVPRADADHGKDGEGKDGESKKADKDDDSKV